MLNKNLILEQKQDEIDKGLENLTYKIIVLDDDPTGTQTVKDLPVYTDWSLEYIKDGFQQENQMFYILTNSRALNEAETTVVHKEIMTNIEQISTELDYPFIVISRGDSTLRGHFYLEPKVLNDSASHGFDGVFYIPAFFEGQRYTYNGIHYLQEDDAYIPVANSEFAQDTTFGFTAERMDDFIAEKSNGEISADNVYHITLQQLRNRKSETLMALFDDLEHFDAVVVDALNDEDLDFFVACLTQYLSTHQKQFMFRTAASFVKAICETPGEIINLNDVSNNQHGGIIIVGSHVKKSSDQLQHLINHSGIYTIEFDVTEVTKSSLTDYIKSIIAQVEKLIEQGKDVVVYTSRDVIKTADLTNNLSISTNISNCLVEIVSNLAIKPKFIIAKGGITSSDVATKGLNIKKATVIGQITKGVPIWLTGSEAKYENMPYVIFPGNVGAIETLTEVYQLNK